MSRSFNGTSDYLDTSTLIISGEPLTMACWFNSNTLAASQGLMSLNRASDGNHYHCLAAAGGAAGDPIRAITFDGTSFVGSSTTTGYSANTWHHACGVWASSTSRTSYIDGGSKNTNTTSSTPTIDKASIGRFSSGGSYMNGEIAEACAWDVALTDAEVAILATGVSPLKVRPQNIVCYWPIIGRTSPEIDIVGGIDLTVNGATVAEHPRIFNIGGNIISFAAAGAAPVTGRIMSSLTNYGGLAGHGGIAGTGGGLAG